MDVTVDASAIDAIRHFNRFYTALVGSLDETYLDSEFSLVEVRVMFELTTRESATAGQLAADLHVDPGYLSRLVAKLARRRLIRRTRSPHDGRIVELSLTAKGRETFAALDSGARDAAANILAQLDVDRQARVIRSMTTIEAAFNAAADERPAFTLRTHRPGDMGWVVQSQGELYWKEYGWDERFEALVARIVATFIEKFDARRERCWIAERHGERVGSVFVVRHADREGVAQLRLLLVDPSARGLGLGKRLVDECTVFAREAGYHTIMLWTNSVLDAARHIYIKAGYRLISSEPHESFGKKLVAQTWELTL